MGNDKTESSERKDFRFDGEGSAWEKKRWLREEGKCRGRKIKEIIIGIRKKKRNEEVTHMKNDG